MSLNEQVGWKPWSCTSHYNQVTKLYIARMVPFPSALKCTITSVRLETNTNTPSVNFTSNVPFSCKSPYQKTQCLCVQTRWCVCARIQKWHWRTVRPTSWICCPTPTSTCAPYCLDMRAKSKSSGRTSISVWSWKTWPTRPSRPWVFLRRPRRGCMRRTLSPGRPKHKDVFGLKTDGETSLWSLRSPN